MGKIIRKYLAPPDDPIFKSGLRCSPIRSGPLPASRTQAGTRKVPEPERANDVLRIARAIDFAARKHAAQRRKGEAAEPYINHLAEVALLVAEATKGADADLVIAALLHDTIEDQGVRYEELAEAFGAEVADLVQEVTDDKTLPKAKRKALQVEHAPHKSPRARMLKIADKTSNLRSILASPPADWSVERKREYFEWAAKVVAGCRGVNRGLEAQFDEAFDKGKAIF
ncbi:MAG TPA: HD domain-containing protein [Bellilinea sp.]|nr:HD domain-containing protein [Bellilinea sp.]